MIASAGLLFAAAIPLARDALTDVWQLHRAIAPDVNNYPDARIANLDTSTAHWIKAVAARDGSFSITNGRTGETRTYPPPTGKR